MGTDDANLPLYRQVATLIEDSIVDGVLKPGQRAPSTNELASFHAINPATARNGLMLLSVAGVLEKRRGLGMFVTPDAPAIIAVRRREGFTGDYVAPLIDEAARLNYSREQLHILLDQVAESRGLYK